MKKTNMDKELALLSRCTDYLDALTHNDADCDDAFENIATAIGEKVKGTLTLPKWKAACKEYFQ